MFEKEYTEEVDMREEENVVSLEDFLAEHSVEGLTEDIVISERLKNFTFKIGSMTKEELEKYQKICIVRNNRGKVIHQDTMKFNELIVINHCVYPNFKSQEFLQKLGVSTPTQGLTKTLKVGEISKLAEKIMEFNGFDEFEDVRKRAKN